jgi:Flp pilus assembly protein TadB
MFSLKGADQRAARASVHLSSSAQDRALRKRLRGKPLASRAKWVLGQVAYVAACIGAFVAVLKFADGAWMAVGLTVVAVFAGGIFEVVRDFRYRNYRQEWELANGPDLEDEDGIDKQR